MAKTKNIKVLKAQPLVVLNGGVVKVQLSPFISPWELEDEHISLGEKSVVNIMGASSKEVVFKILDLPQGQKENLKITLTNNGYSTGSRPKKLFIPLLLSENHSIGSSPVCDIYGNIYFIDLKDFHDSKNSIIYQYQPATKKVVPFLKGISAPTSLAFFEGVLLVTSMLERKVYRCIAPNEAETFSQGLGSTFGIAVNSLGEIFAGDQAGSLFKIDSTGKASFYTSLPETFKGYHFAISQTNQLYVAVPSNMGKNTIYHINDKKEAVPFIETMNVLGGVAFSSDNKIFWVENSREEGMVLTLDKNNQPQKVVSGNFILGLAFNPLGDLIITDLRCLYYVKKEWIEV